MRCLENPFWFGSTCVDPHDILEPYVTQILWYPNCCTRYGRYFWTPTLFGLTFDVVWSISCTGHHSYQQGNIVPWPHTKKTPSGIGPKHCRLLCGIFLQVSFPQILDIGGNLKEHKRYSFLYQKNYWYRNNLLAYLTNFPKHLHRYDLEL
jgi:hypothetical protein